MTFDVRETRHGPILETATVGVTGTEYVPIDGTFALRWAAVDGLLEPSSLVDLVRASSFDGFRQALRGLSCPGQNVVYADVDGTIGYQCAGRFPLRRAGDGSAPVAGWTSEHEWDGYLPFDALPWSKDPSSGFIVTANNRIHDDDYPHLIGLDFHPPFRARRIAHLLASNDAVYGRRLRIDPGRHRLAPGATAAPAPGEHRLDERRRRGGTRPAAAMGR